MTLCGFSIRIAGLSLLLLLSGCGGLGGGGSSSSTESACSGTTPSNLSPSTSNTMPVYQSTCAGTVNIPAVTLHICVPNTTTCEDVPNILVDYGSTGLRLSHLVSITSQLPQEKVGSQGIYECYLFVSGYNYGPVVTATITLGTTVVNNILVQVSNSSLSAPSSCSSGRTSAPFQPLYNGILGLIFPQGDFSSAYYYEGDVGLTFTPTLPQQVQNPVYSLPSGDNNGVIMSGFPTVSPTTGASNVKGILTFGVTSPGIYTQLETNSYGFIKASYNSLNNLTAFFDTGSNGFFIDDNSSITPCTGNLSGFFCGSASGQTADLQGWSSTTPFFPLIFSIENAQKLFSTSNNDFSSLGGPQSGYFDAGFPAFLLGYEIGIYWPTQTSNYGYFIIK